MVPSGRHETSSVTHKASRSALKCTWMGAESHHKHSYLLDMVYRIGAGPGQSVSAQRPRTVLLFKAQTGSFVSCHWSFVQNC